MDILIEYHRHHQSHHADYDDNFAWSMGLSIMITIIITIILMIMIAIVIVIIITTFGRDRSEWPVGPGQLTAKGKRMHYHLGKVRNSHRYNDDHHHFDEGERDDADAEYKHFTFLFSG